MKKNRDIKKLRHTVFVNRMMRWLDSPVKNLRNSIIGCFGLDEEISKKLVVKHPREEFGDLTTNLLKVMDKDWQKIYFPNGDKDVVWTFETYLAPAEKVEIINGMINIWLEKNLLIKKAISINNKIEDNK